MSGDVIYIPLSVIESWGNYDALVQDTLHSSSYNLDADLHAEETNHMNSIKELHGKVLLKQENVDVHHEKTANVIQLNASSVNCPNYELKSLVDIHDDSLRIPYVIPRGYVWVEGDNHHTSHDSRSYGPLSKALITDRVIAIIWPLRRWRSLAS